MEPPVKKKKVWLWFRKGKYYIWWFGGKKSLKFDNADKACNKFVILLLHFLGGISQDPYSNADKLRIESELPVKRKRITKIVQSLQMNAFTYLSEEIMMDNVTEYVVMDEVNLTMNTRFSDKKELYLDIACFYPRISPKLKEKWITCKCICYETRGNCSPQTKFWPQDLSSPPSWNLFSAINLVKTMIIMHNLSIQRNRSVFFSISLPLW